MEPDPIRIMKVVEFLRSQPARRVPFTVLDGNRSCGTIACHTGWLGYILYAGGYHNTRVNPLYDWDFMVDHFNRAIFPEEGSEPELIRFALTEWLCDNIKLLLTHFPSLSPGQQCVPHIRTSCAGGWRYGANLDDNISIYYPGAMTKQELAYHYSYILAFWQSLATVMAPAPLPIPISARKIRVIR